MDKPTIHLPYQESRPLRRSQEQQQRADGMFYHDLREPFTVSPTALAAVTLAATAKALYTAQAFPVLGAHYFNRPGKALRIRMLGRMTTAATPGNGSFNIHWGTGADANGTLITTAGTPVALVANGTTLPWSLDLKVYCVTTGTTGTLFAMGRAHFHVGLILSTAQPIFLPASAPVVSAALDLSAANIISVQYLRSGSTAETMQVHDLEVTALN